MDPKVITLLQSSHSVAVIAHYNPDGDAYSSTCSLVLALRSLGKQVYAINESANSERYFFIPGVSQISQEWPKESLDAIVVVDCGDLARVGEKFQPLVGKHPLVINIDHHKSNSNFGKVNFVEEGASSTAEMVYSVIEKLGCTWTADMASAALTGIVSDTGSFKYASTTASTLRIAASLVDHGASLANIGRCLFEERSKPAVLLQSYLLSNLKMHCNDHLAVVTATEEEVVRFGAVLEDLDGLVEEARAISGVLVSLLIRQDGDIWRVSMRAKILEIDVSKVAAHFGGGGHRAAAAFRWRKSLDELKASLIPELEKAIKAGIC